MNLRKLFFTLTGGRPMQRESCQFIDSVSGESVCYYDDRLGRRWLAVSPWALFRVPISDGHTNSTATEGRKDD